MKNKKYEPRKRKPIREITSKKSFNGERSPYWQFMDSVTVRRAREGAGVHEIMEDPLANPDVLSEEDSLYNRPLTEVGELQKQAIEETVASLSDKERVVFEQIAQEGKTLAFTAGLLDVSISTVQTSLTRIRTKMKRRFEQLLKAEN